MYRQPAAVARDDEPTQYAAFRVCHRAWGWLLYALIAAGVGLGLFAQALTASNTVLVVVGSLGPIVLVMAACHAASRGAGEVELITTARARGKDFDVTLRRRWGFLPWAATLSFTTSHAPSLVTRWETGRTSNKHGQNRGYRRASLVVAVGEIDLLLPIMRGPQRRSGADLVAELAPAVGEAKRRYDAEIVELGVTRARERRGSRAASGADEPRLPRLVGVADSAFSTSVGLALLAVLVAAVGLGLAGAYLPASRIATSCCALTLPVFGLGVAGMAVAVAYGQTLYLRQDRGEIVMSLAVADTWLFGPRGAVVRTHARNFPFHIETRREGDDDDRVHALVDATSGEVLRSHFDRGVVRQLGLRLGGREIKGR